MIIITINYTKSNYIINPLILIVIMDYHSLIMFGSKLIVNPLIIFLKYYHDH